MRKLILKPDHIDTYTLKPVSMRPLVPGSLAPDPGGEMRVRLVFAVGPGGASTDRAGAENAAALIEWEWPRWWRKMLFFFKGEEQAMSLTPVDDVAADTIAANK
ncbi:hypothetical protein EPN28_04285 [Patescibacteria group bacterium]|nr:MAG: hypothetical protein EPN28_04285 [Patescibacteria group bacterium]